MDSKPGAGPERTSRGTPQAQGRGDTSADAEHDSARRVTVSPIVGGRVRTWSHYGSRLWSVDRPEELAARLLCGDPCRYAAPGGLRTAGAVLGRGALRVPARAAEPGSCANRVTSMRYRLTAADPARPDADEEDRLWGEMFDYLAVAVRRAGLAGEPVVIGPGGWDTVARHTCTIGVYNDGAGPASFVDARPAPAGAPLWRGVDAPAPMAAITAPARLDTLPGAALYAIDALLHWGFGPWDVTVSYGRYRGELHRATDGIVYPGRGAG